MSGIGAVQGAEKGSYSTDKARSVIEDRARVIKEHEHRRGNYSFSYEDAKRVATSDQRVLDRRYGK